MSTRRAFLAQTAAVGIMPAVAQMNGNKTPGSRQTSTLKSYRVPHTDLEVSRIAYGCDKLGYEPGTPEQILNGPITLSSNDIAKAARVINVAHENGITFFDLADIYGGGRSEAAFGEVLKQSPGLRNKIVIQSKCGAASGLSRNQIISAVEGSLKRLGTDRLDILLLHVQDPLMEPQEVAGAFDELKRSGKARYFGVSNHTISRIELLKKYVHQPLVVSQIYLGLGHSDLIDETPLTGWSPGNRTAGMAGPDYCRLHEMQVQAYSPLKGRDQFEPLSLLQPPTNASPQLRDAAQLVAEMARKKETTPAALALAWLLRHPCGIVPIIGATNPEHVVESCSADRVELSRDEWNALFEAGRVAS